MVVRRLKVVSLATAFAVLAGCYTHSFPDQNQQLGAAGPDRAQLFVDANGTFYPSDWEDLFKPGRSWGADSLLGQARHTKGLGEALVAEEQRQLAELRRVMGGKQRIFILIHGFNDSQPEVAEPYAMIEQRLITGPGDAIIRFYWDGYDDKTPLSAAHFWWMAAGNSQMAGSRALRKILTLATHDQKLFLISHSRGASVVLSALSNPPYAPQFKQATEKLSIFKDERAPLEPPAFKPATKNIHSIMLAPAVDWIDFTTPECGNVPSRTPETCALRDLPGLASLHYTINPCDEVLNKYAGLSHRFNPTGLGLRPEVGRNLNRHYQFFHEQRIVSPHDHDFAFYTADREFSSMMAAVGVATRPWPTRPPAKTCRRHAEQLSNLSR